MSTSHSREIGWMKPGTTVYVVCSDGIDCIGVANVLWVNNHMQKEKKLKTDYLEKPLADSEEAIAIL